MWAGWLPDLLRGDQMDKYFDVVVVGGGHAGISAAVAAAESGCRTVLINDRPMLGGNASSECGVPAHGAEALGHNRNLRDTGILEDIRLDFYCRCSKHADITSYWDLLLYERCRKTPNLTLAMNTRMISVDFNDRDILSVDAVNLSDSSFDRYHGKYFIDGTGDGNLGYSAGASYRFGRESKDEFDERYLGHDKADGHTLGSSIYGWAVKRDYPVDFTPPEWAVHYDSCDALKHRPHNIDHILPRVTCSEDGREIMFFWWLEWGGELNVIEDSGKIYEHLKAEMFGLWDHLKNHCDDKTREALRNFELCRWSAFPLRRESRRLVGDYILNEKDLVEGRIFEDEIGYGGWPMDDHPPMGIASMEPACNQLFLSQPYSVPYRCFYSMDFDNLFMVGRCISVTHAALSSVRIMNTLGSLGEAVGVAAGLCCRYGSSARELGLSHMAELKQEIINRDLYLLGTAEDNPLNLAKKAICRVSSELSLNGLSESIGKLDLRYDTALQIPISSEYIDSLSVYLDSSAATAVGWELWAGTSLGFFGNELLASGTVDVDQGRGEYKIIDRRIGTSYGMIVTLVLKKNAAVCWEYGKELYHTRWGVAFKGPMKGLAYHGASMVVPNKDNWVWVNNHGRLPEEVALWTAALPGYKRHSKLFITPMFSILPEQKPYGAENLNNNVYRSAAWPNLWISGKGLPQTAALSWKEPQTISRLEIIFDTNLDYADQRYGFPRKGEDYTIPDRIEETVNDYRVNFLDSEGQVLYSYSVDGNIYRRNSHVCSPPVAGVASIELEVEKSGNGEARVFGIKVF